MWNLLLDTIGHNLSQKYHNRVIQVSHVIYIEQFLFEYSLMFISPVVMKKRVCMNCVLNLVELNWHEFNCKNRRCSSHMLRS